MNRFRQALRVILDESVLFFSYRWLAWGFAGLSLVTPITRGTNTAFEAWLLILTGVLNVLATALAHSYLRIVRRRPGILALDIVASVAVVWASGGNTLPFLPYALGALVIPALLLTWRGRLLSCIVFALFDWTALWLTAHGDLVTHAWTTADAAVRLAAPFLFVLICVWFAQLIRQVAAPARVTLPSLNERPGRPSRSLLDTSNRENSVRRYVQVPQPPRRSVEPMVTDLPVTTPFATLRTSDVQSQELRREIFSFTPHMVVELPLALDQLATGFGKRNNLAVRTTVIGQTQSLPRAQHLTLLRLAQESLLNVQQHAHAHSALLTLRYDRNELTLTVQDDGVGLLDGTHERPGLHGLRAVAYRLAEIDGSLEVFEGESGGVTVRGIVPLRKE